MNARFPAPAVGPFKLDHSGKSARRLKLARRRLTSSVAASSPGPANEARDAPTLVKAINLSKYCNKQTRTRGEQAGSLSKRASWHKFQLGLLKGSWAHLNDDEDHQPGLSNATIGLGKLSPLGARPSWLESFSRRDVVRLRLELSLWLSSSICFSKWTLLAARMRARQAASCCRQVVSFQLR